MPGENRYVRLVYRLLPVGALGMSVALGAAPARASAEFGRPRTAARHA